MNTFKKLQLEYQGLANTITAYSSDFIVTNHLAKLGEAIASGDYDAIMYLLKALDSWYDDNYVLITSSGAPSNAIAHKKGRQLIKDTLLKLNRDECQHAERKSGSISDQRLIFISHKSDDREYGDAIRQFLINIGVKNDQIIYTSHPLNGIRFGVDIYDYLRDHISDKILMVFLWSEKYLDSPACLNEMGAAWVMRTEYVNMFVPDFPFGSPKFHQCAIDTHKMGAVLNGDNNCRAKIQEFKDIVQNYFSLKIEEKDVLIYIEEFIERIKAI